MALAIRTRASRTPPSAVLAGVEGEEELGVADDRLGVEPDAPPADHHAGRVARPRRRTTRSG